MRIRKNQYKNNIYVWSGQTSARKKTKGEICASSISMAKILLKRQSITPYVIRKKIITFNPKFKKISAQDITIFFRQLATLINSGISLSQALLILLQDKEHLPLHKLIYTLFLDLEAGKTFAHSLKKYSQHIDIQTCHLIRVAEQTGKLDLMLIRIANNKEKSLQLKTKIKQALFYPITILITACIVTAVILLFVVPQFAELFQSFHRELPSFTLAIIHLSHFICQYVWIILFFCIFILSLIFHYKKSTLLRQLFSTLFFCMPRFNIYFRKKILAQFARTLAIALAAGIPIIDALKMTMDLSEVAIFQRIIQQLVLEISSGRRLHQAMISSGLFPAPMMQMIKIGEESGRIDDMLDKLAELYENDIQSWIKTFSQLLEPLIIMILGVLIGGLVIAMYLPIFKLGTII